MASIPLCISLRGPQPPSQPIEPASSLRWALSLNRILPNRMCLYVRNSCWPTLIEIKIPSLYQALASSFSSPLIGTWLFRSGGKKKKSRIDLKKEIKKNKERKKNSIPFSD